MWQIFNKAPRAPPRCLRSSTVATESSRLPAAKPKSGARRRDPAQSGPAVSPPVDAARPAGSDARRSALAAIPQPQEAVLR